MLLGPNMAAPLDPSADPLLLLDSLPDEAAQLRREQENQLQRLGFTREYTAEQQEAFVEASQRTNRAADAIRNQVLVQARETEFQNAVANQGRIDPHPSTLRLIPAQDPAGGRKKKRRRAAARRQAPTTARAPAPAGGRFPSVPAHRNPDQIAEDNMTGVRNWHSENARDGTYTAYEPKKQEWDEFCARVYGPSAVFNVGATSLQDLPPQTLIQVYTVTPNKCYNFIFYQAHRKPRPRRQADATQFGDEELAEYHEVNNTYGGAQANPSDPPKCLGFSQVNIYKATVYNIFLEQKATGCNSFSWEDVNTDALKLLMKKVRNRAPLVSKRNAEEKIDAHMAPFFYVQWLPHIEKYFFSKGVSNHRSAVFSSLRNAFTFKFSLAGVLRGESLERADLSDLCDYFWQGEPDPYPIHMLIMAICQGKTNQDRKLFGRAMRHRQVEMCPLGALALYLWYRLDVRGEWADARPDFLDNHAWFFIKLLVSSTSNEVLEELDIKTYADAIQEAMDAVGVSCNHRAHFGRKVMPILLEMCEVLSDLIKNIGLWCRDVQEKHYAASMPLQAMRVAAGHKIERGSVFYKRGQKPISACAQRLRKLIFPWLDHERARVHAFNQQGPRMNTKPTASGFLGMLDNLRDVLLQDIACRMNNSDSPAHQVFRHPIFQSNDFQLYRQEMQQHMDTFVEPEHASLQRDHPGVSARFDAVQNQLGDHQSMLYSLSQKVDALPETITTSITTSLLRVVANGANDFATSLLHNANSDVPIQATPITPPAETGERYLAMPPGTAPAQCIAGVEMSRKFASATEIFEQYHGLGEYVGKPIDGGFASLEESGTTWRSGYNNSQVQHFSKVKRIVRAMEEKIGVEGQASVFEEFNSLWTMEEVNMNPTKMISKLQQLGILKVASRKRKDGPTAREVRRTQHQAASASAPLATGGTMVGRGYF